jgi:hypothetical protein
MLWSCCGPSQLLHILCTDPPTLGHRVPLASTVSEKPAFLDWIFFVPANRRVEGISDIKIVRIARLSHENWNTVSNQSSYVNTIFMYRLSKHEFDMR